jgi:hypothetical protein
MTDQLTITVNKSTSNEAFQIFNDPPTYDGSVGTAYINVWGTAPEVNSYTDTTKFQISYKLYAVCGNGPSPLAKGLVISTEN